MPRRRWRGEQPRGNVGFLFECVRHLWSSTGCRRACRKNTARRRNCPGILEGQAQGAARRRHALARRVVVVGVYTLAVARFAPSALVPQALRLATVLLRLLRGDKAASTVTRTGTLARVLVSCDVFVTAHS